MNYKNITSIIDSLNHIKNNVNSTFTKICLVISAISVFMLIILMNQPTLTVEDIEILNTYELSFPLIDSKYLNIYKCVYISIIIISMITLMYFLRKDILLNIKLINELIIECKDVQLLKEEVGNFILYVKQANSSLCVTDEEKIKWAIKKLQKSRKLIKEYK